MRDALKSYLALAGGMTEMTKQRAVLAAKQLVAQGEATASQVQELAEDLLQQSKSNREAVTALVRYEVERALGRVGLATQDEVEALTAKVHSLESQLAGRQGPAKTGSSGPVATRAPQAPAKQVQATKAAASQAPVEKAGAATSASSPAAAKKAAPKPVPAKPVPAKKAAPKPVPAKPVPAKPVPAKKPGSGSRT